uniref:Membrane anchored junction protein n=1 Tax=Nannospalax galili TaxID=1026970 RepID=A0A8C6QSS0_NANGA
MSLKPFTYPFPETRFLHTGSIVYKFKIRYGDSIRGEEMENKETIIQELEDSIRAVLANMDNLQPFVTEHFIVFPYKSKWERVSHLKFKHGDIILAPYPFIFTLYVEMKWLSDNWLPGKRTHDIPLELILAEHKAEEAVMRKRKLTEEPSSPGRPGPHRAKMETASQASRNKKCHMNTRRSQDGEPQQKHQDIAVSDATEAQEHGSKCRHGLPGPVVPPLQQGSSSPKELGTSGFFGFLSSLFPFRHFFRKSSQ